MNNFQINIYLSSFFALGLSIIFNYLIFTLTKNRNYQNNTEEVRLSKRNVPPLGGIAIALSFLISVRLLGEADSNFVTIGLFGVAIALLGVFDDFFNLKRYQTFRIVQIEETVVAFKLILYNTASVSGVSKISDTKSYCFAFVPVSLPISSSQSIFRSFVTPLIMSLFS